MTFKPKKKKQSAQSSEDSLRKDLRDTVHLIRQHFGRKNHMLECQIEKLQNRAYNTGHNEGYGDGYHAGADDVAKGWIKNKQKL